MVKHVFIRCPALLCQFVLDLCSFHSPIYLKNIKSRWGFFGVGSRSFPAGFTRSCSAGSQLGKELERMVYAGGMFASSTGST